MGRHRRAPDAGLAHPTDDLWSSFNFDLAKEMNFLGEYPTYPDISAILPPSRTTPPPPPSTPTTSSLPLPFPILSFLLLHWLYSLHPPPLPPTPHPPITQPPPPKTTHPASTPLPSRTATARLTRRSLHPSAGQPLNQKSRASATRGKRAATKPKPYPRISDVVRDAPQKFSDANKRPSASTELKGSIRSADAIDDDWRPTLEEYQKMSSKEKRQLRNKISARNFRVRRKGMMPPRTSQSFL
jgi:hypothetical protein